MLEEYRDVISVDDLCAILNICRSTAYNLLKKSSIQYRQIGRNYKIRKDSVISFLSESNKE